MTPLSGSGAASARAYLRATNAVSSDLVPWASSTFGGWDLLPHDPGDAEDRGPLVATPAGIIVSDGGASPLWVRVASGGIWTSSGATRKQIEIVPSVNGAPAYEAATSVGYGRGSAGANEGSWHWTARMLLQPGDIVGAYVRDIGSNIGAGSATVPPRRAFLSVEIAG